MCVDLVVMMLLFGCLSVVLVGCGFVLWLYCARVLRDCGSCCRWNVIGCAACTRCLIAAVLGYGSAWMVCSVVGLVCGCSMVLRGRFVCLWLVCLLWPVCLILG